MSTQGMFQDAITGQWYFSPARIGRMIQEVAADQGVELPVDFVAEVAGSLLAAAYKVEEP